MKRHNIGADFNNISLAKTLEVYKNDNNSTHQHNRTTYYITTRHATSPLARATDHTDVTHLPHLTSLHDFTRELLTMFREKCTFQIPVYNHNIYNVCGDASNSCVDMIVMLL